MLKLNLVRAGEPTQEPTRVPDAPSKDDYLALAKFLEAHVALAFRGDLQYNPAKYHLAGAAVSLRSAFAALS